MMTKSYADHMNEIARTAKQLGMWGKVRSSKEESIDSERTMSKSEVSKDAIRREQQGRNEPCNCGSGKKFKKCCGRVINKED